MENRRKYTQEEYELADLACDRLPRKPLKDYLIAMSLIADPYEVMDSLIKIGGFLKKNNLYEVNEQSCQDSDAIKAAENLQGLMDSVYDEAYEADKAGIIFNSIEEMNICKNNPRKEEFHDNAQAILKDMEQNEPQS